MSNTSSVGGAAASTDTDEEYRALERLLAERVAAHRGPLFTTSADPKDLWGTFLHNLPEGSRQHYNCRSCAWFVERFGGLVSISERGHVSTLLWHPDGVPEFFRQAAWKVYELVQGSRITGVFLSSDGVFGIPSNPENRRDRPARTWTHLHGAPDPTAAFVHRGRDLTAEQKTAEKLQEHEMLRNALREYPAELLAEALRVLRSGSVSRAEKALERTEWLAELSRKVGPKPNGQNTQLWLAVAAAPPGFAHVKSSVIATLLEDVRAGLPFAEIKRRWDEKLDPEVYRRPTAAPKEGAIDAAEKLVEKLGVARALDRRFARLSDVPAAARIWWPAEETPQPAGGTFGHLRGRKKTAAVKRVALPPQRMSWARFRREVLPEASSLEVATPARGPYFALTTAEHADAPTVFQWENPVAWYFHGNKGERNGGGRRSDWNLSGEWGKVSAVSLAPPHWADPARFSHLGQMALFYVVGQRDLVASDLALFPELLRSEFHGIGPVVEAHSRSKKLGGALEADACGVAFQASGAPAVAVRVDGVDLCLLDRWE